MSKIDNDSLTMVRPCPVCNGICVADRTLFDDRYGYPETFVLLRCEACEHRALDTSMSPGQLSDLYTNYYPRSDRDVDAWELPSQDSAFKTWWRGLGSAAYKWVPRDVRVLDIGCGFGESLGYHRARGCDAHGVEADRNILRVAQRHGLNVEVGLFDPERYAPESFDYVTLDQVIEHVTDPAEMLTGIARVLRPGGTLVISTPNASGWGARTFGSRWIHWHTPYHTQFFSRGSMVRAAAASGLQVVASQCITNAAWLDYQWGHLVTFPRLGEPSVYWAGARAKRARTTTQRIALKLLLGLDRLGVNAALTRLADMVGLGDNRVYLLRKSSP